MKNWRIYIILGLVFVSGAAVISRLFYIQIINNKFYQSQALGQQAGFQEITGARGQIFFTNSRISKGENGDGEAKSLAINRDVLIISAVGKEIENKEVFSELLSKEIGESKEYVMSKIDGQDSYTVIKKDVSADLSDELKNLNLNGLRIENSSERFYPQETLAAQVSGFLGGEGSGQYGIEGYYDDMLKGKAGIKEVKRGLEGVLAEDNYKTLNGSDVYLTIDYNIQFKAESLLKEAQKNLDIDSGQILVIKPDSGRILAMVNFPAFNPNEYSKVDDLEIFQNSTVQKLFEPGSVMKPFTMAIGINEGKITPDTTYIDEGFVRIGKDTVYNYAREKYGKQTMIGVLEKSINTGAIFVEQKIPHITFFNYMDKLGFTQKTGIDLQGEAYSWNDLLKNGPDLEYATASYGQGIEITPIQLVKAFSIFANKGKLTKPHIVEKIFDGYQYNYTKIQPQDQIVSEDTALKVTKMMVSVLENGFAKSARVPGYYLAGKTGTAQVPLKNGKGYDPQKTIQSFIGFGPAYNPKFLILVKLDNPKVPVSSLSSTPVFQKMAQYIINYWQIPPDYDIDESSVSKK